MEPTKSSFSHAFAQVEKCTFPDILVVNRSAGGFVFRRYHKQVRGDISLKYVININKVNLLIQVLYANRAFTIAYSFSAEISDY